MKKIIELYEWDAVARIKLDVPIIIRNGAKEWPAFPQLQPDNIKNSFGSITVQAEKSSSSTKRSFQLDEFFTYMDITNESNPWYVTNWMFRKQIDLIHDITLPPVLDSWLELLPQEVKPEWIWMFIGPKGSTTPLHVDVMISSAWNSLFYGTKRWNFYSPALSIKYGLIPTELSEEFSKDEWEFSCNQYPGDILITPSGIGHEVINEEKTVAVTGNFVNESNINVVKRYLKFREKSAWLKVMEDLERRFCQGRY